MEMRKQNIAPKTEKEKTLPSSSDSSPRALITNTTRGLIFRFFRQIGIFVKVSVS